MRTILGLVAIVALVAANGAFVAAEFALVAADRGRIAGIATSGSRRARLVQTMFRHLSRYLSGAQLGVTVCSIVLGFLAEPLIATMLRGPLGSLVGDHVAEPLSVGLGLLLATVGLLIFAELVPKNVAVAKSETAALALAPFLRGFVMVFSPIIWLFHSTAEWVSRRIGIEPIEESEAIPTLDELDVLIRSSGHRGTLDAESTRLLTRSIRFADKMASDVLVPRLDVAALKETGTAADLAEAVALHGYSRFPLYRDGLDEIVGVVLAKDLLSIPAAQRTTVSLASLMKPILAVPEAQPLRALLIDMRKQRRQLAVVIDEYGGTAGILTLEDVIEEIVGDIDDEHDDPPLTAAPADIANSLFHLDGDLDLDRVREESKIQLPEGDYDTLAGFVLVVFDRIPKAGDTATWRGWQITIAEMDRRRIARVSFQPVDQDTL